MDWRISLGEMRKMGEKMGKRGMSSVVVGLIALVFVILIIWGFTTGVFASWLDVMQGRATCQTWVDVQASTLGKVPLVGIKYADYKSPCQTRVESVAVKSKENLYKEIADRMYGCLADYRFGKENFYGKYTLDWSRTYCRFCNEVHIESKNVKEFDWEEFQIYLNIKKPLGDTRTYAVAFTEAEDASVDFGKLGKTPVDKGKPFYILFTVDNHASWSERLKAASKAVGAGFIYESWRDIKNAGGIINVVKIGYRNIADVRTARQAFQAPQSLPLYRNIPDSAFVKPGYGSAFTGLAKKVKFNVYVSIVMGAVAGATVKDFNSGVAVMTGEDLKQAIDTSECDEGSLYINPVVKDRGLESKLARYRKEKEDAAKFANR